MTKFSTLIIAINVCYSVNCSGQVSISSDGSQADANTMLQVKSTTKGVKFPQMTSDERKAIPVTPADAGLMVYDSERQSLFMYDGSDWIPFAYASVVTAGVLKPKSIATTPQGSGLGHDVAVDGNYAVIGSKDDTVNNNISSGCAYIFKKENGNWILKAKLAPADPVANDGFGKAVAINGDYVVVGSGNKKIGVNYGQGAAYVFVRSGESWTQQAMLTANDGATGSAFGISVAIQGSTILIGASWADVGGNVAAGSAYIFKRSGTIWSQTYKLTASDGMTEDHFGGSVDMDGDYYVVGAWNGTAGGYHQGTTYVFYRFNNVYYQAKLVSPVGGVSYFGDAISIDSATLVIGAPGASYQSFSAGAAYVFKRTNSNTWTHSQTLNPSTSKSDLRFGETVSVSGDYILVGGSKEDVNNVTEQGSVYLFKWNGSYFLKIRRITDNDGLYYEHFGYCVAFDGKTFVIGVPEALRLPSYSGKGMVFFGAVE